MAITNSSPIVSTATSYELDQKMDLDSYPSVSAKLTTSPFDDETPSTSTHPTPASSPTDPTEVVRVLKKSECKQAADTLALAFKDDELARYFTHTEDRKHYTEAENWDLHVFIMHCIVKAHVGSGMATVVGEDYDCVALWMPPGKNMDDWITEIRSGIYKFHYKLSKQGRKRFFDEFLPLLHNTKHEVLKQHDRNSWYLVYIGTKPDSRGKGYARALIEHTTRQADSESRLTYLESTNAANAKLYARLGFEAQKTIFLTRAQKPVCMEIMIRKPVLGAERNSSSAGQSEGRRRGWWAGVRGA